MIGGPEISLLLVGLLLALLEELNARGRSILGWAVVFVCLALLWGRIT